MIDSGFMGMVFKKFWAFSGFMDIVFYKNSLIGELFWHFQIYGCQFQTILQIHGILLRHFSRFMGGTFTI